MSVENLSEKVRSMIIAEIKANISQALTDIRTDRADPRVTTEPPRKYFIYGSAYTYECPAIFAVVDSMDFRESTDGQNFISSNVTMYVSAVVEDRDQELLTIKCERYQAALFRILHERVIEDAGKNIKTYILVKRAEFSPVFTKGKPSDEAQNVFRKESALKLEVRHYESPTTIL